MTWGPLARTGGASPSFNGSTCSSTYCHGATLAAGGTITAPLWAKVDGTQAACGTCHGAPPPAPHTTSTACGSCHEGYTATSVNLATHIDGQVQSTSTHPSGWVAKEQHGYQANLTGLAGCKSCHGTDLNGGTSGVSCNACHSTAGFSTWATGCTFCHGSTVTGRQNPPVDVQGRSAATNVSVGVHESHATTTIATPLGCAQCHPARTASVVTDAAHVDGDGIAEVAFGALAKTGNVIPTYTRSSATSASCGSTYCHGNFAGGANATVSWTSTTAASCTSCHGSPPPSGRHLTHMNRGMYCSTCHSTVVNATNGFVDAKLHVNGTDNVKFGGTYEGATVTGSYTGSGTNVTCTVSCHNTKRWR
jgi:predicted CxxxxCH...CXXCH cytochrome family protein